MNKQLTRIIGAVAAGIILVAILVITLGLTSCGDETQPAQTQALYAERHTFQSAAVTETVGTAMKVAGYPAIGIQVEGITTATITFQATIDGSTWYAIQAINQTNGDAATTTTADGLFFVPVIADQLRCNITSYTAGTITVSGLGTPNVAGSTLP